MTIASTKANVKVRSQIDVLQRLPCLVAHLIAESLGYFTPEAGANAIAHYTKGEPFFCEWYYDWASKRFAKGNTKCADLHAETRRTNPTAA